MKTSKFRILSTAIALFLSMPAVLSQSVGINNSGAAPDASAMLDVSATNKGVLIPRVQLNDVTTQAPVTAVTPVEGLLIYNASGTVANGFYYWDGSQWVEVLAGNKGINSSLVLNGNTLELTDPGGTLSADLSSLKDSTDNDSVIGNEYNTGFSLSGDQLDITDGGGTYSVDLSPYADSTDADSVVGNETISSMNLTGSNILEITEAGVTQTQDLSSLAGGSSLWTRDAANGHLYPSNIGDSVAVGTNAPSKARFEVQGAPEERVAHFEADFDNPSTGIVRTALFKNNGHTGVAKFRAVQGASIGNDDTDGRSTGIFGKAGGRDHNIAVFGQLNSSSEDGTGIFGSVGSISASSTSDLQANSYAGYFQGDVALTAALEDNNGATGTAGEVLTSTGTGVEWQSGGGGSGLWSRNSTDNILYPTNAGDSIHLGFNARHAKIDLKRLSDGNGFSINQGVGIKGKASQYNGGTNVNIGVWGEGQGYASGPGDAMSMGVFGMSHPDSNAFMTAGVYARLGSEEPSDWGSYSGNAALQADGNNIGQSAYFQDGAVTINFNGAQSLFHVANGSEAALESNNSAETGYIMTGRNSAANIRMDDDEILAQNGGSISTLDLQQPGGAVHVHSGKVEADQFIIQDNGNVGIGDNTPPDKLYVNGDFSATGAKNFRIQHPEKEGKVLYHAAIESDQRINKYTGKITTDDEGRAVVELPDYVQLINKDFRYNLTVIGTFAQAIVGEEFEDDSFVIETDEPNVKVSWELTGVRDDPYARENPYKAVREAQKEDPERKPEKTEESEADYKKEGAPSLDRSDR